ncbi:MAG: helix-turn-helix domain-containing protein [Candidatus Andersenbacteria bacterium]
MSNQAQLEELGLSPREAAVYAATLTLGTSSVLRISREAKIPRATTYLALGALEKIGLVTVHHKRTTTLFSSGSPSLLTDMVDSKEHEHTRMTRRERDVLAELIPRLNSTWKENLDRTHLYTGIEELKKVHSDLVMHAHPNDIWYRLMPVDNLVAVFGEKDFFWEKAQQAKGMRSRLLFTTQSPERRMQLLAAQTRHDQRKALDGNVYKSSASITVCRDRVVVEIIRNTDEISGVVINSDVVATLVREMLRMVWSRF